MHRKCTKTARTVTRAKVTESPPVVEDAPLTRNTAVPINLGDDLEIAVAFKLVEGVQEYFKQRVKQKAIDAGVTDGESEHGQLRISAGGGPSQVVNIDRFLEACKTKRLKVVQRNALISVSKGDLAEHFSEREIVRMCDDGPPASGACTIEQKKSLVTPLGIPDALKMINRHFKAGNISDKTFLKKSSAHKK